MRIERLSEAMTAQLRSAPFTYDAVGRTGGEFPPHFAGLRRSHVLPPRTDFEAAAAALMTWQLHTGAGLRVRASSRTVEDDAVVLLGVGLGRFRLTVPCRVAYVVDEAHRRGFAYGTLPGHPESGEELFVVEEQPDGRVRLDVAAFSRPATTMARLGGPATRWVQGRITDRYLHALDTLTVPEA